MTQISGKMYSVKMLTLLFHSCDVLTKIVACDMEMVLHFCSCQTRGHNFCEIMNFFSVGERCLGVPSGFT